MKNFGFSRGQLEVVEECSNRSTNCQKKSALENKLNKYSLSKHSSAKKIMLMINVSFPLKYRYVFKLKVLENIEIGRPRRKLMAKPDSPNYM